MTINAFLVYLEPSLVAANVVLFHWGSYQRSPNSSSGFEGPLRGGERERIRKRKEGERK